MPRALQIEVEDGRTVEETADRLAMSASATIHELFPEEWQLGMALMAQRINRTVAEENIDLEGDAWIDLLVEAGEGEWVPGTNKRRFRALGKVFAIEAAGIRCIADETAPKDNPS